MLNAIAAILAQHGTVTYGLGTLHFNGMPVAYRRNGAIVLCPLDRGEGNWMSAKTTHASAEIAAADILWRVSECKPVAA